MLAAYPDLLLWLARPTMARLADVRRQYSWPFLSWCFATGLLVPDVELLVCKAKGAHDTTTAWARFHSDDVDRARRVAVQLGWKDEWATRVAVDALGLVCLTKPSPSTV